MNATIWDKAGLNLKIRELRSFLCVGLDTDLNKLPLHFKAKGLDILDFNRAIIDATFEVAVAYKINSAFYEVLGAPGLIIMEKTIQYIHDHDRLAILDAKRGDIGNTGNYYAEACFNMMKADAVTVSPYMGKDSIDSFLAYKNKWTIILALTSNTGSKDFQQQKLANGKFLYEEIIETSAQWASDDQIMYVTGATQAEKLHSIRKIIPKHFLLIPGIGAQGGDLHQVIKNAATSEGDILINASRSILYASSGEDFAEAAATEARKLQLEMSRYF